MLRWLQIIAQVNPLTYAVDVLRGLMIVGGTSIYGVGLDLLMLFLGVVVLVIIGPKLYPKVVI